MTEFKWLWRRRLNYSADSAPQMSWWFAETAFTDGTDRGKKVYALNLDRFLLSNLILHQLIDWQNNTAPWTLLVTRHLMRKSLNWLPGWPLASTDLLLLWALLGLAIWWHIWKCTLEKSPTRLCEHTVEKRELGAWLASTGQLLLWIALARFRVGREVPEAGFWSCSSPSEASRWRWLYS